MHNNEKAKAVEIKKAIITAAGKTQRTLPLQTLVDRDGVTKTALRISSRKSSRPASRKSAWWSARATRRLTPPPPAGRARRLQFVEQTAPLGYGHAVSCAREFAGGEPFLLLVGDHLYVSGGGKRAAQQLVEIAKAENCAVSAVQATHESKLPYYGTVGGRLVAGRKGLYEISEVIEKPTPTEAEQRLIVPGLRAGHYLCFFGMHVLTPAVMEMLAEEVARAGKPRRAPDHRPGASSPSASATSPASCRAAATTSASSTACSPPNSRWRWTARTATRC